MLSIRTILGVMLAGTLAATAAEAEGTRSRIHSKPTIPSPGVLRRLNLVNAWKVYVPMDGQRDGILVTELHGKDLFVLTRSGLVVRIDAESGRVIWRSRVGKPYTLRAFVAANNRSVYVAANVRAYGLDRATGTKRWDHRVAAGVSASPVADDQQVFIPTITTRLYAFYLPFVGAGKDKSDRGSSRTSLIYGERELRDDKRLQPNWTEKVDVELALRPVQSIDNLLVISPEGRAVGFTKILREGATSTEIYRFSTEGKIRVEVGSYGDSAYIGSEDANLYAINIASGKLRWRHTAGSRISRRAVALKDDVYVTSGREGLSRLNRSSGEELWKIPRGRNIVGSNFDADLFLAANDRYVYATDHSNRLLVLDRKRGRTLARLDTSAFRVPIVNEVTDRVYLAANNGLIVCLHDRDQPKAIRHRKELEELTSPLRTQLEQKITATDKKEGTLRDVLSRLRTKYKLKFVVGEEAFKAAGMEKVQDRKVTPPLVEDKPLGVYLDSILKQAGAGYETADDTVLIVPAKPKEKPKEKPNGKPKPLPPPEEKEKPKGKEKPKPLPPPEEK